MISLRRVLVAAVALSGACDRRVPAAVADAGSEAGEPPELAAIVRAEDARRVADIPEGAATSHDARVRRRVARALARIATPEVEGGLLRALEDEDPETVGWAAYGLGFGCKGREDPRVRALAARAGSLEPVDGGDRDAGAVDPRLSIGRAVGKCGGALAEQVLVAWVRSGGRLAAPGAYGLGDVAKSGGLTDEASNALIEAASASGAPPREVFLYPFGRLEHVSPALAPRVLDLSRRVLSRPSTLRGFAIRALSRAGAGAAEDLARICEDKTLPAAERAEAARGLGSLGEAGRVAAGGALARLAPDKDPFAIVALGGDEYGTLLALLEALGGEAPREAIPALHAFAALTAPGAAPATLLRRLSELRCVAAGALASGAYDADVLTRCDPSGGPILGRAKLAALGRRPLVGERRTAWAALARSADVRVREDALELLAGHPELGDAGRAILVDAIASPLPGVVATAADVITAHPDRILSLSPRAIREAADPAGPPPTANAPKAIDGPAAAALTAALARSWSEDLVETRVGLLDAAAAVRLPAAREAAERACRDENVTVREHARNALQTLGDAAPACPAPPARGAPDGGDAQGPAPAAPAVLARRTRVVFTTDAGEVSLTLEPDLAPVAAARFVELARRGFYKGIVVHRVVPGFVVQFGDPGGDGYGGSGALLRCETSPVPFEPLDVGVALSGRDTGSSQIFVTLDRYPHLDGEYAKVGSAKGDWAALAEGDLIRDVRVEP